MAGERPRPKKRQGVGRTIGGILVGFDEQVWRRQPPAQERAAEVDRLGTAVTPSGLSIDVPGMNRGSDPPADRSDQPRTTRARAR